MCSKNGHGESDHEKVLEYSAECTRKLFEVKKKQFFKTTHKVEHPTTAPKPY